MPMRIGGLRWRLALRVEERDELDHLERRAHRGLLVVRQRKRRAEDRHQPVARPSA